MPVPYSTFCWGFACAGTLIKAHRTSNMIAYAAIRQASRSDAGVMGDEYDQFASDDFGSDSDSTFAEDESSEDGTGGPTSGLYEVGHSLDYSTHLKWICKAWCAVSLMRLTRCTVQP